MIRFSLLFAILALNYPTASGQPCVVSKDVHGQVVTVCDVYYANSNTETAPGHKQVSYLGSPYLTFPAWQKGTIRIDQGGRDIECELAYDLVANEVICQLKGESTDKHITPYAFTIDGLEFVRQMTSVLGIDSKLYTTVLHNGATKLSKSFFNRLVATPTANGYEKSSYFNGFYKRQEKYYIQKGDARSELTDLSRASLLAIFYDQSEKISQKLTTKQLTVEEATNVLMYYDSLTALANVHKPPLSADAVFNQFLHDELNYPNQAWLAGVYGRVYIGFDVDEQGKITNISTLSPENIGFGFDQEVKRVLAKLTRLKPDYKGTYALPVAFTYTHTQKKQTYVPVNNLPAQRLAGRTLLDEYVAPIVVSKPIPTIREVWGYYK